MTPPVFVQRVTRLSRRGIGDLGARPGGVEQDRPGDCGRIQNAPVAGHVHQRQHDPAPALARGAGLPGVRAGDGRSRVAGQRRNGADQAQIRFQPPVNVGLFGSGLKSPFNLHVHPLPRPDRRADQPNARHRSLACTGRFFVLAEDGDHFRGGAFPVPAADHGRNLLDAHMVVGPSPAVGRDLGLAQDLIVAPTKPAERRGIHPNLHGVGRGNFLTGRPTEFHAIVRQPHGPQQPREQPASRFRGQRRDQVGHVIVLALQRRSAHLTEGGSIHRVDPFESPGDETGFGLLLHWPIGPPGISPGRNIHRLALKLVQSKPCRLPPVRPPAGPRPASQRHRPLKGHRTTGLCSQRPSPNAAGGPWTVLAPSLRTLRSSFFPLLVRMVARRTVRAAGGGTSASATWAQWTWSRGAQRNQSSTDARPAFDGARYTSDTSVQPTHDMNFASVYDTPANGPASTGPSSLVVFVKKEDLMSIDPVHTLLFVAVSFGFGAASVEDAKPKGTAADRFVIVAERKILRGAAAVRGIQTRPTSDRIGFAPASAERAVGRRRSGEAQAISVPALEAGRLRYVLLVGDADVMPVRYMVLDRVTPAAFDYAFYPSDLYYADVAKAGRPFDDWNACQDAFHAGYFGEVRGEKNKKDPINYDQVDYRPEIAVGRWPVSTPERGRDLVAEDDARTRTRWPRFRRRTRRAAALFAVGGWVDSRGLMDRIAANATPQLERRETLLLRRRAARARRRRRITDAGCWRC